MIVEPQSEFQSLSEEEVLDALADPDSGNLIAAEVARLITAYTENFIRHVEKLTHLPSQILLVKPRCPIVAVAMRLTTENIRVAMMHRPSETEHHA